MPAGLVEVTSAEPLTEALNVAEELAASEAKTASVPTGDAAEIAGTDQPIGARSVIVSPAWALTITLPPSVIVT